MSTIPGRLTVGADGRLAGAARIEYNTAWPCVNGSWGSGAMSGVLMHTMVGNLPGTVAAFNNPSFQASAHFGIDQAGLIHQFGPIGKGWIAWHAAAANQAWYGIEHADDGNPDNPLTPEQIASSAQLVECLSAFAGFPLALADAPAQRGYGTHAMGGAAWGGHTCPDLPPAHVRSGQRPAILALAAQIRQGASGPPYSHSFGGRSVGQVAASRNMTVGAFVAEQQQLYPAGLFLRDVADMVPPDTYLYWTVNP